MRPEQRDALKVEKIVTVTVFRDGVVNATAFAPSTATLEEPGARRDCEGDPDVVMDFVRRELV